MNGSPRDLLLVARDGAAVLAGFVALLVLLAGLSDVADSRPVVGNLLLGGVGACVVVFVWRRP